MGRDSSHQARKLLPSGQGPGGQQVERLFFGAVQPDAAKDSFNWRAGSGVFMRTSEE